MVQRYFTSVISTIRLCLALTARGLHLPDKCWKFGLSNVPHIILLIMLLMTVKRAETVRHDSIFVLLLQFDLCEAPLSPSISHHAGEMLQSSDVFV